MLVRARLPFDLKVAGSAGCAGRNLGKDLRCRDDLQALYHFRFMLQASTCDKHEQATNSEERQVTRQRLVLGRSRHRAAAATPRHIGAKKGERQGRLKAQRPRITAKPLENLVDALGLEPRTR